MSPIRMLPAIVCLIALLTVATGARTAFAAEEKHAHHSGAMEMHHLHLMANHGLVMALQGSTLMMLGQMKMAPGLDEVTLKHGKEMFAQGKKTIEDSEYGPSMKDLHKAGHGEDPLMKYTHALIDAMEVVLKELEKMESHAGTGDAMTMHHMHIAVNHALEMAAEGSNLMMIGQMGMAKGSDEHMVSHGKSMIADARKLWKEVMEGKAMKDIHGKGMSTETAPLMGSTHRIAEAGRKVIDLQEKMPGGK